MFTVGQSIGSYQVVRKLGQGGMGAVFEVLHQELARRAAIKVLHPEYAKDEHSIQRFFNEARAVNIIRHPGLVGVFESGRLTDGCAYIVMEFLDGELLSNRLERVSQLPLREVLHLGRQISSALDVAHRKGIVHRDLKPSLRTPASVSRNYSLRRAALETLDSQGFAGWAGGEHGCRRWSD